MLIPYEQVHQSVAAIVSAFHGAADLTTQIRPRKSTRDVNGQRLEESQRTQLHLSLLTAESQIDLRYVAETKKLGERMRRGDGL